MKVKFDDLYEHIRKALLSAGLSEEDASTLAKIHTESSRDGVYSHGFNRVPKFLEMLDEGVIDINAQPELVKKLAYAEQYDGNFGMGVKNALFASARAAEMAKENGLGIVAIRNTNHWQRAATYTMNICDQGLIGIAWSNTNSNMPAWGSSRDSIGNNPLSIAIPYEGDDFILDMAMSQYSFGKLQVTASAGQELDYIGGVDKDGNDSKDPKAITDGGHVYPMGYWKGSGLAIALDLLAAILSDGNSTYDVDKLDRGMCVGVTQIFIALDPKVFASDKRINEIIADTISYIKEASDDVSYPGERMIRKRRAQEEQGIEVDEKYWNLVEEYINGKQ